MASAATMSISSAGMCGCVDATLCISFAASVSSSCLWSAPRAQACCQDGRSITYYDVNIVRERKVFFSFSFQLPMLLKVCLLLFLL